MEREHSLLLNASLERRRPVQVVVDACMFACCGRAWRAREGYEQTYVGTISSIDEPDTASAGGARLTARGHGGPSYFVIFGFDHVIDVQAM